MPSHNLIEIWEINFCGLVKTPKFEFSNSSMQKPSNGMKRNLVGESFQQLKFTDINMIK